jgi:hypothetical protein
MKNHLPPHLADVVRAFRAEMSVAREQEAARLHEAFDDFKRKMESGRLAASANWKCRLRCFSS